eukprot:gene953-9860_t
MQKSYHNFSAFEPISTNYMFSYFNSTNNETETEPDDGNDEYCKVREIANLTDYCGYVRNNTDSCNKFLQLNYCEFSQIYFKIPYYLFLIFYIYILFYLLGDTAEEYFVPSLTTISDYLKLSPNVAGVTLLALGNGAPDLSSIIVSVLGGSTAFGIGAPIGGGLFVCSIVLGIVCFVSDVKVTRRPFLRDTIMYFVSTLFVFAIFLNNRIAIWESIICILLYILYVIIVVMGRFLRQQWNKRFGKTSILADDDDDELYGGDWTGGWREFPIFDHQFIERESDDEDNIKTEYSNSDDEKEEIVEKKERTKLLPNPSRTTINNSDSNTDDISIERKISGISLPTVGSFGPNDSFRAQEEHFSFYSPTYQQDIEAEEDAERKLAEEEKSKTFLKKAIEKVAEKTEWEERKIHQKIHYILIESYWTFFRDLSIFRFERDSWNKWYASAVPFFSVFILLFALGDDADGYYIVYLIGGIFPFVLIFLAIGAFFSILVFVTTLRSRPPIYRPLLVFHSFFLSIVWIYVVARELFLVLDTFGVLIGIPQSILAITVLAWGNSVGDAVSDVVVARKGFPSMAVGAIYGAPLLNLLIGLGIAFTFNETSLTKFCFPIPGDANVAITFIFLIISLVSAIVVIPLRGFRAGRIFGAYMIFLYVVYLIFALTSTIFKPFRSLFEWNFGTGCPR